MEDYFTNRNGGFRVLTGKVDDTGSKNDNVQYLEVSGRDGEEFTRVMRVQHHGMSSNPPKESHALVVPIGNKSDTLLLIGAEHPDHRPKKLDEGDVIFYNATNGTTIHLKGNKIIINAPGDIEITAKGNMTLKAKDIALDGNVSLGGPIGSGKPAAQKGTVDTGDNVDVANLARKVKVN